MIVLTMLNKLGQSSLSACSMLGRNAMCLELSFCNAVLEATQRSEHIPLACYAVYSEHLTVQNGFGHNVNVNCPSLKQAVAITVCKPAKPCCSHHLCQRACVAAASWSSLARFWLDVYEYPAGQQHTNQVPRRRNCLQLPGARKSPFIYWRTLMVYVARYT